MTAKVQPGDFQVDKMSLRGVASEIWCMNKGYLSSYSKDKLISLAESIYSTLHTPTCPNINQMRSMKKDELVDHVHALFVEPGQTVIYEQEKGKHDKRNEELAADRSNDWMRQVREMLATSLEKVVSTHKEKLHRFTTDVATSPGSDVYVIRQGLADAMFDQKMVHQFSDMAAFARKNVDEPKHTMNEVLEHFVEVRNGAISYCMTSHDHEGSWTNAVRNIEQSNDFKAAQAKAVVLSRIAKALSKALAINANSDLEKISSVQHDFRDVARTYTFHDFRD